MEAFQNDRHVYSKLEIDAEDFRIPPRAERQTPQFLSCLGILTSILLLCTTSFWLGHRLAEPNPPRATFDDVIPTVPIPGNTRQLVTFHREMQTAAPADASHEPAWDQLIPNGLGYVKHPALAPDGAMMGVFHQLHCLYSIRRAYYAAYALSRGQDFDLTGVREPGHINHCFDYLQQSLTCAGDADLEPARKNATFARRCRDFERIKVWAEEWRDFDGSGFLFDTTEGFDHAPL